MALYNAQQSDYTSFNLRINLSDIHSIYIDFNEEYLLIKVKSSIGNKGMWWHSKNSIYILASILSVYNNLTHKNIAVEHIPFDKMKILYKSKNIEEYIKLQEKNTNNFFNNCLKNFKNSKNEFLSESLVTLVEIEFRRKDEEFTKTFLIITNNSIFFLKNEKILIRNIVIDEITEIWVSDNIKEIMIKHPEGDEHIKFIEAHNIAKKIRSNCNKKIKVKKKIDDEMLDEFKCNRN